MTQDQAYSSPRERNETMSNTLTTTAALTPEASLSRYLAEIRKFPMLEKDEEYMLAKRFAEHEDTSAAHKQIGRAHV